MAWFLEYLETRLRLGGQVIDLPFWKGVEIAENPCRLIRYENEHLDTALLVLHEWATAWPLLTYRLYNSDTGDVIMGDIL